RPAGAPRPDPFDAPFPEADRCPKQRRKTPRPPSAGRYTAPPAPPTLEAEPQKTCWLVWRHGGTPLRQLGAEARQRRVQRRGHRAADEQAVDYRREHRALLDLVLEHKRDGDLVVDRRE